MKIKLNLLIVIVLSLFLISCSTMYISSAPNVPLHKDKNEFKEEINVSLINGFDAKLAYSPIKYIGVKLDGQYFPQKMIFWHVNISPNKNGYDHQYIEGQLGSYLPIKLGNNIFHIELYGGYGEGKGSYLPSDDYENMKRHYFNKGIYKKYFLQFDLVYEIQSIFAFGLSNRVGIIDYRAIDLSPDMWFGNGWINHNDFEPYFFWTAKISDNFDFTYYIGYIVIDGNYLINNSIFTNVLRTGIGVKYTFGKKKDNSSEIKK